MSHQATPCTWYAVVFKGDRPNEDVWITRTRRGEGTNAPDEAIGWRSAPVVEGRMGNARRKHDEEQVNANLFAAPKEAMRALLALIDSKAMTGKAFREKWGQDFDPWENTAEIIAKG